MLATFDGFTILHISDLHSKQFGEGQHKLLNLIKQQNYEVIAITGDLVDKRVPDLEPGLQLIEKLVDKPVYVVPGNHEWWTNYQIREPLLKYGVKILENKAEKFYIGQQHICLLGVDDPYLGRDNLPEAMSEVAGSMSPKILLAHAPNIYHQAISKKIDLLLAGHNVNYARY